MVWILLSIFDSTKEQQVKAENQKVQFGKYKGKLISWVVENDYDYAIWLLKKSNSTTMTKRAVQSIIDKKAANLKIKTETK